MRSLIIIPTYNERENITGLIDDVLRNAPSTDLLIVDDNSPDGTGQLVDEIHQRLPQVHVLHRPDKLGLGTAYVKGFQYAIEHGYDFVFEMDADYSHDPSDLPRFFEAAQQADLVIGSRYVKGGGTPNWSAMRKFISGGGNRFARFMLRIPTHDCTAGFRCYRTAALSTIDLRLIRAQGYAFQVEMTYIFWKRDYRVREVPVIFIDRRVGKSKMSRTIFVEAFRWVIATRFRGDPAVRQMPRLGAAAPQGTPAAQEVPASESAATQGHP